MLNKTALNNDTIAIFFDMMIWLSAQYGPPVKQSVPRVIKPKTPLHERCWKENDERTVFDWAEAEAVHLSEICKMSNWSIQVAPNGQKANLQSESSKASHLKPLKSDTWCENKYPGYFTDYFGRPTFFYDPRRCAEAGYFAKTLIPQFALLKLYTKYPPIEFSNEAIEQLMHMTVCHMGLGFTLLALSQKDRSQSWGPMAMVKGYPPHNAELHYLYGTLLSLAAHGLTEEQIVATYGRLMTQRTRKIIKVAYGQIDAQTDVLKLLRLMAKPTHTADLEHNLRHPTQASNDLEPRAQGEGRP